MLLLIAVAHLAWQGAIWLPSRWDHPETAWDAHDYYLAARRVRDRLPLYRPWPDYGPDVMTPGRPYPKDRFPYPPPFAALLAPFAALPEPVFIRLWTLLLLAAFWVYAGALARLATGGLTLSRILIAGLAIAAVPQAYLALSFGNVDPLLWALFGLALATPVRGAAFAASALVKLYATWPLLLASAREGRRVMLPAACVILAGLLVGAAACGSSSWIDWARYFLPVLGQGTFNPGNLSLSFAGIRLARVFGWRYLGGPLPFPARLYLTGMTVAGPLGAAWIARRGSRELRYATVGVSALAFGPLCWPYYLALMWAPAAVAWRERPKTAGEADSSHPSRPKGATAPPASRSGRTTPPT